MGDFTYGKTKLTKQNFGIFLRDKTNQAKSISTKFVTKSAFIPSDVLTDVTKGLFLDLPLFSATPFTTVPVFGSTHESKIMLFDFSGGDIEFEFDDFPATANKVYVLYAKTNTGNTFSVTDIDGNVFTSTRGNQGVVVYVDGSGDMYIADTTFTPIGVAEQNPKISSSKKDEFTESYGNVLTISKDWVAEGTVVELTEANKEYLDELATLDNVDFALYAHSSKGAMSSGILLADADASLGFGGILKSVPFNSVLNLEGNNYSSIPISLNAEKGISEKTFCFVSEYFPLS